MILRRSFLKYLLAPLAVPLVKFLPKREKPRIVPGEGYEAQPALPTGDVVWLEGTEDLHQSDAIYWEDGRLLGYALHDASPGDPVLVSLSG